MKGTKHTWKPFLKLLARSNLPWSLYGIGLVGALIATTVSLGLPKVTQQIYEGEIFDTELIIKYITLSVSGIFLTSFASFFLAYANPITKRNIQRQLWPNFIYMPLSKYQQLNPLTMISRVTIDPGYIYNSVETFRSVITATYSLVGSFIIMYGMNVKLTLALLPVIPYILIVSALVGHFTQKAQSGVQSKLSVMTAFFAERIPKIRLIKTFGKEAREIELGKDAILHQYEADKKRALVDLYAQPLMHSVRALIIGTVLIYGAYLVGQDEMKISEVIAFYLYVQIIHNNVLQYGLFWQALKQAVGASEKIADVQNTKQEELKRKRSFKEAIERSNGNISLENVSFNYGEKTVLSQINLTVPKGKSTAIVGPSGSGKSTLFALLERLYQPNVGRVMIGGIQASEVNLDEWRHAFANVSQTSPLLSGSLRENILYGLNTEVSDEIVMNAAKAASADDFIKDFPDGLDTDVGEYGSKLSGGQRQRVAIARALIMDPEYLLLDEATSSLDAESEHKINNALKVLMKGRTTVSIIHHLNNMSAYDQIILLDHGRVSGAGTHDELLKSNTLYKELFAIQQEKARKLTTMLGG